MPTNNGTPKPIKAKLADEVYGTIQAVNRQNEKIMFKNNMILEKKDVFFILLNSLYQL